MGAPNVPCCPGWWTESVYTGEEVPFTCFCMRKSKEPLLAILANWGIVLPGGSGLTIPYWLLTWYKRLLSPKVYRKGIVFRPFAKVILSGEVCELVLSMGLVVLWQG